MRMRSLVPLVHLLAAILLITSIFNCTKDRDNPLDPVNIRSDDPFKISLIQTMDGVEINWQPANMMNVKGYSIFRSDGEIELDQLIGSVSSEVTNFTDPNIVVGENYYYRIAARDSNDRESLKSSYESISIERGLWSVLAHGLSTLSGMIVHNNQLIVGGMVDIDGFDAKVAYLADNNWAQYGSDLYFYGFPGGSVYSLNVYNNYVVVGGKYQDGGFLYYWSGSEWVGLIGSNGVGSFEVHCLTTFRNMLAMSGKNPFEPGNDGVVELWDGNNWTRVLRHTGEDPYYQSIVSDIIEYNNDLYIGGEFFMDGADNIRLYNGSEWSVVDTCYYAQYSGTDGPVYSLSTYNGLLIVGGQFTQACELEVNNIVAWNGTSWFRLSGGLNGRVLSALEYNGNLVVGGEFTQAGNINANNIAIWNGLAWSALGFGTDGPVTELVDFGGQLIVGGSFSVAGGIPANNIAVFTEVSY